MTGSESYHALKASLQSGGVNVALLPLLTAECERLLRLDRIIDDAWTALRQSAELTRQELIWDDEQLAPIYREAAARAAGTDGG